MSVVTPPSAAAPTNAERWATDLAAAPARPRFDLAIPTDAVFDAREAACQAVAASIGVPAIELRARLARTGFLLAFDLPGDAERADRRLAAHGLAARALAAPAPLARPRTAMEVGVDDGQIVLRGSGLARDPYHDPGILTLPFRDVALVEVIQAGRHEWELEVLARAGARYVVSFDADKGGASIRDFKLGRRPLRSRSGLFGGRAAWSGSAPPERAPARRPRREVVRRLERVAEALAAALPVQAAGPGLVAAAACNAGDAPRPVRGAERDRYLAHLLARAPSGLPRRAPVAIRPAGPVVTEPTARRDEPPLPSVDDLEAPTRVRQRRS